MSDHQFRGVQMTDTHQPFNADAEVARLRANSAARRKTTYRKSRLDRYCGELVQLHNAGASTAELQRWLREHRVCVTHSTVARWLKRQDREAARRAGIQSVTARKGRSDG